MAEPVTETVAEHDPRILAGAWLRVDPDADHRAVVAGLIEAGGDDLQQHFGQRLTFGTAGLRGRIAPGPGAMNRVLVRVTAAAIAQLIIDTVAEGSGEAASPLVVIGFDARHYSRVFAEDTARVIAGFGIDVKLFDRVTPTPILAFAVKHLQASAGVMVTASHNPRTDNGYKVYWRDGAQIRSPIDTQISQLIDSTPLLTEDQLVGLDDARISAAGDKIVDAYVNQIVGLLDPAGGRTARVAYTPLHGVGGDTVQQAFIQAGFEPPAVVDEQALPNPDFPTTPFPNPEEPGVLDPLFRFASEMGADVAMANDPDADRLAVAVPVDGTWRLLSGDELGCLLADYLLSRRAADERQPLVVNTVVSSRLLGEIASAHDAAYEETLTGFKWIMAVSDQRPDRSFVLGYEEALGYCVGDAVRDKDGVSAALLIAEIVSELSANHRTLLDLLDDIHQRDGAHVTGQRSLRFEEDGGPSPASIVADLRMHPPLSVGEDTVVSFTDLQRGDGSLPPTDGIIIGVDHGQLVVRPSGTEPKLKVYGEVWADPNSGDLRGDRIAARLRLQALLDEMVGRLADPERTHAHITLSSTPSDDHEVEQRAAELFQAVPQGAERARLLRLVVRCVDLTTLAGDDTPGRVRALCALARRPDPADPTVGPTAAVCVYPALVELAAEISAGTGIHVASVAGAFPSGLSSLDVRLADIEHAIQSGADEIDVVLNRSAFLSGHTNIAAHDLREMRRVAVDVALKVTIEIDELGSQGAIREATKLAIETGADWVKTSTGKTGQGATPAAALTMAEVIAEHAVGGGRVVGLEISGGVRTADDTLGYLSIVDAVLGPEWLTPDRMRFGASSGVRAVVADLAATEYALRD